MKNILTSLVVLSLALTVGCFKTTVRNSESNAPTSESRPLSGFIGIKASGSFRLVVTAGEEFSVTLEGGESAIANVVTGVDEGMLIIKNRKPPTETADKVRLKISLPALEKLELYGATDAVVSAIKGADVELSANGTSTIAADGKVTNLKAISVGSSKLDAAGVTAESATANATGASEITVNASKELVAEALGASNVYYLGDPKVTKNSVGASEIRKK